ncbi:FAD binding domain-containing protein [Pyrenochaeta sp. MPI-SDFR-AT-0127]|nr:FAD binding domain-containing protein [Pyrenochaeta sp. MPI-SDFR-AT-0127]
MQNTITIDLLIIGAGPAGLSLACFLGSYGLKGMVVSNARSTADTPRAHLLNAAATDCLRDIGLDTECFSHGTHEDEISQVRWAYSMIGEEYSRVTAWGYDPQRTGDYRAASPSLPVDIPQTLLEPILLRYASQNNFDCRFAVEFIGYEEEASGHVVTTLRDLLLGQNFTVRSKYLFGADGARSQVVKQAGLPLVASPAKGLAINVLVDVDMSHLVENKRGSLHWLMQPDVEHPSFDWLCICRLIKAHDQWMFIFLPAPGSSLEPEPQPDEYLKRIKEYIGDTNIPAKIRSISKWNINEIYAETYANVAQNVVCLGDAVHRHPPHNGLGSNTCIQDAFNLAWKIAYVIKGLASPSLLTTYSAERQPIGRQIVQRANQALPEQIAVCRALGMLEPSLQARKQAFRELEGTTDESKRRRELLTMGIRDCQHEFNGLGIEMNQSYESSAVYLDGEASPSVPPSDPVLYYHCSSRPGSRLPHAWLNKRIPGTPISTIDLAGNGHFSLFTGAGGEAWRQAATTVSERLTSSLGDRMNRLNDAYVGQCATTISSAATSMLPLEIRAVSRVPSLVIRVWSIGWKLDWEDVYMDWIKKREIEDDGCLLVRPDRTIAWRCIKLQDVQEKEVEVLERVMRRILGLT